MLLNCGAREDSLESLGQQGDQTSQSQRKSTLNIHWKDCCWSWSSSTLAIWCEEPTHLKRPYAGKDWGQEKKGATEDEIVGWYHWLNGREFEKIQGDSKGQGSLVFCSSWDYGVRNDLATEQQHSLSVSLCLSLSMHIYYCFVAKLCLILLRLRGL